MKEDSQPPPIIREQTLERIARHFGERGTGEQIVKWLEDWGVPQDLIEYPNTKWRMVCDILEHYARSTKKEDNEMLFKIISEMLHPLMFDGDKEAAQAVTTYFNKFLEYDGVLAEYSERDKKCYVYRETDLNDEDALQMWHEELFEQEYSELESYRQPENKEKISILRKAYQILMNITEVFCANPSKPTHELNDAYIKMKSLVVRAVSDLHLRVDSVDGVQQIHKLTHYCIPFNNLFTAEAEYKDYAVHASERLHWDDIRPKMHATYGCIDELYRKVDGSDILSKPDVQQTLNDVSLLLSKTKEENRKQTELKRKEMTPKPLIHQLKITEMPELQIKAVEVKKSNFYITKNGDDFLYKGRVLKLSKKSDYYKVFSALYAKLPSGGEISYKDLITEVKSRFPEKEKVLYDEMKKFIQRNLTDKSNGFVRYADIPETEDNGRPLIYVNRGSGIVFNNQAG